MQSKRNINSNLNLSVLMASEFDSFTGCRARNTMILFDVP
ncbi:hypothetical protein CLOSTMETH_02839 [[Clostridium] methylpentosum DSM 5476]|uniref:Uncharacterized protein n=1 Tax=[Clostridium] methylpentosum DSM 5476 TaxID=537013 RepID=C0EG47_9FIRM|nr:hypothetical protein CLOSTMETH_02839 [[Clostridium] methylpentosum DSM 5476]